MKKILEWVCSLGILALAIFSSFIFRKNGELDLIDEKLKNKEASNDEQVDRANRGKSDSDIVADILKK